MRKFVVREDKNYCRWWWTKVFFPRYNYHLWSGKFMLTASCWWSNPRDINDFDINKIVGVGFGLNHHKNSWRIGYIPIFENENRFKIYGYFYDKSSSTHVSEFIGIIEADKEYSFEVESIDNRYFIVIKGDVGYCSFENVADDPKLQFTLYPYAGGDNAAIHEMTFYVELKYNKTWKRINLIKSLRQYITSSLQPSY